MNQNFDYQPSNSGSFFDPVPQETEAKSGRGYAIASLVLGIVSLFTLCCCCICNAFFIPMITAVLAIVFAILAKNQSTGKKFPGMAIAGLILGIVGLLLSVLLMGIFLFLPDIMSEDFLKEYEAFIRAEMGDEFFEEYRDAMGFDTAIPVE